MFIAAGSRGCSDEKCAWRALRTGFLAGAGAAAVLDAALLAYDEVELGAVREHRARRVAGRLSAGLEIGPERRALVLSSHF